MAEAKKVAAPAEKAEKKDAAPTKAETTTKVNRPDGMDEVEFTALLDEAKALGIETDAGLQLFVEREAARTPAPPAPTESEYPAPIMVRCTLPESEIMYVPTARNRFGKFEMSPIKRGDVFPWLLGEETLPLKGYTGVDGKKKPLEEDKVRVIDKAQAERIRALRNPTHREVDMIVGPLDPDGEIAPQDLPYPTQAGDRRFG